MLFCVELREAVQQSDQQLTERLLPVIKQRHDAATQALSDCLTVKDVAVHWLSLSNSICHSSCHLHAVVL